MTAKKYAGYRMLLPEICALAWPTMLEQLMQTAVQYIDTAMVGRLGAQASAAVGLTSTMTWLVNAPLFAMGIGVLPLMPAMVLIFVLTAAWWVGCSLPLWKSYKQEHFVEPDSHPVREGMRSLGRTIKEIGREKHILLFLIAFFFFIDGVYTIIDLAVAYGTDLGFNSALLLLALLVTQIVAFPAAILLGMLSRKVKPQYLILACIAAYFLITIYAIFLDETYEFWILAVCVGLFQGTIQAMSRAYYAKIIPPQKAGEYFGVYDIFGKGASFLGTFLVALVADVTGMENLGVGVLSAMFLIGFVLFIFAVRSKTHAESLESAGQETLP